jgi:Fe-S cluster biogenesis protein NfuA
MASPPCVSVAVRVSRLSSRSEVKEIDVKDRVEKALDLIRPALQNDGGNVELVDVDEAAGIVKVKLVGACGSCPMSQMTLRMGVERVLKEEIPEIVEVQAV